LNTVRSSVSRPRGNASSTASHRFGIVAFVVMAALLCSSSRAQNSGFNIGPSGAQVYGAIAGVAGIAVVGTILAVNHSHHTLKGCAFGGPDGLRLQTSDSKIYNIEGDTATIKAGDNVKLHGSRVKRAKGYSGDQVFKVEKLNKNYGPCHVTLADASRPPQ